MSSTAVSCVAAPAMGLSGDAQVPLPTAELLQRFYPNVLLKKQLGEFETLLSNEKLKRLLGWQQHHRWRDQVKQ